MTSTNAVRKLDTAERRIYVLDTNVLMHDPSALFRFQEHDIFLPMTVIEELDKGKTGMSEASRNARQASRFIDHLIANSEHSLAGGSVPIVQPDGFNVCTPTGSLFFETGPGTSDAPPASLHSSVPDNVILHQTLLVADRHPSQQVTLVTKDTNLRIKASIHGVAVEDYRNDRALADLDLLYAGVVRHGDDFWEGRDKLDAEHDSAATRYTLSRDEGEEVYPNQGVIVGADDQSAVSGIARDVQPDSFRLDLVADYTRTNDIWGIHARNPEQNIALNLLMDPNVEFVSLLGGAGTGKTLLALAAGLTQVMDQKLYNHIIVTRATVSVGDEIGYLPGTEEEKMSPWMGAVHDNLEYLLNPDGKDKGWEGDATNMLVSTKIKINSMSFMRGRTFLNKYIILDEAQNLTPKQMKTLITRAGPGTKIVCLGNIEQIDTPYLTETTSGLTYAVDRFKSWPHSGHVTLQKGERSRLADFASCNL